MKLGDVVLSAICLIALMFGDVLVFGGVLLFLIAMFWFIFLMFCYVMLCMRAVVL